MKQCICRVQTETCKCQYDDVQLLKQWRMQDGNKRGLNNKDLGLGIEINGDLMLNNRGLMKKSGSCSPGSPLFGSAPVLKILGIALKLSFGDSVGVPEEAT